MKYEVYWWEEHIIMKTGVIDASNELEAQDKARNGDVGDSKIESELREVTDSGHIKTTIIKEYIK